VDIRLPVPGGASARSAAACCPVIACHLLAIAMSRLHSEFARLFLPATDAAEQAPPAPTPAGLLDAQGHTRALVLELAAPADWARLKAVWQGVQADLGLPAPAIAVSGTDGLQLWFSAPMPVAPADARRWLEALCRRYLGGLPPHRLRLYPRTEPAAAAGDAAPHAAPVPALQADGATWSAFVAPDLVPLFEETPWLDSEPSEEGQAALLERVGVMKAGWFEAAVAVETPQAVQAPAAGGGAAASVAAGGLDEVGGLMGARQEALAFLRRVVQDEAAPLALRVEAAKALLQAPGSVGGG
jgi:hypothetical protein